MHLFAGMCRFAQFVPGGGKNYPREHSKLPGMNKAGREDYSITAAQPPLRAIFRVAFPVLSTLRCVLR